MTCAAGTLTFRLLDANVGWNPDNSATKGLVGLDAASGVSLAPVVADAVDPNGILPYLPPARLARGRRPCEWYLATPAPPGSNGTAPGPVPVRRTASRTLRPSPSGGIGLRSPIVPPTGY